MRTSPNRDCTLVLSRDATLVPSYALLAVSVIAMLKNVRNSIHKLTWAQRFLLASLVILVSGMAGIGWWVGQQIESGVVHQTGANTALYVSSIVEPNLQALATGDPITPEHTAVMNQLLRENSLGQHITTVKVWDKTGRIVYATDSKAIGQVYPIESELMRALRGWVASDITQADKLDNATDADRGRRRLETYSPVRLTGTDHVIAAVEFHQTVDSLDRDIATAKRNSWLVVGAVTVGMYLLLVGFVRVASDTIRRQQSELTQQVKQLGILHERVRRAARRTTALNERSLRRISAELHDGPAQDLGFALLRMEHMVPRIEQAETVRTRDLATGSDFYLVQSSLHHALQEIRAISAGMGLPELEGVTLRETAVRAAQAHERRTSTSVAMKFGNLPDHVPLPVKITVYRIIQEALNNAYRHADGMDQRVTLECVANILDLCVSDGGPGFDNTVSSNWDQHLGLVGMRERVESLGGSFSIASASGHGTRVCVQVPLDAGLL